MEETDPEGIVSTLTASFTTYVGYCLGLMLLALKKRQKSLIKYWFLFAFICALAIYPCSLLMPFNKRLYTITFLFAVLSTSITTLTIFFILLDYLPRINEKSSTTIKTIVQPLKWMGMNPLAIFIILQIFCCILQIWITIDGNTPYEICYDACFSWMTPVIGTAVYALFYAIIYAAIAEILFKYKIFLRL
jgi:predicted acyltransferase